MRDELTALAKKLRTIAEAERKARMLSYEPRAREHAAKAAAYGDAASIVEELAAKAGEVGSMPDRVTLGKALRAAWWSGAECDAPVWEDVPPHDQEDYCRCAEAIARLCAGRLPAEAWQLPAKWRAIAWTAEHAASAARCAAELEAALKTEATIPHNAESRALLAVGKRVFNRHTGARGAIVAWPQSLPEDAYRSAIVWDGAAADDVRIVDLASFGLLQCDEPRLPAAVWGLPARMGSEDAEGSDGAGALSGRDCADMLESALRVSGQQAPKVEAPRFHVTQDEWDDALRETPCGGRSFEALNRVLARRPATDEAEALRSKLQECDADWQDTLKLLQESDARLADLESQLGQVTREWDEARAALLRQTQLSTATIDDARRAERECDEALARLSSAEERATNWEAAWKVADRRLQDSSAMHAAVDGALMDAGVLSVDKAGVLEAVPGLVAELARQRDEAREQLAARPEPVVIDDKFTEELVKDITYEDGFVFGTERVRDALRRRFGSRASVSVPHDADRELALVLDWIRTGATVMPPPRGFVDLALDLEKRRHRKGANVSVPQGHHPLVDAVQRHLRDNDELRAELALANRNAKDWEAREAAATLALEECRGRVDLMTQDWQGRKADRDVLRADLEKTRAQLEAATTSRDNGLKAIACGAVAFKELREQHEALRSGFVSILEDMEEDGRPAAHGADHWGWGREDGCRAYSKRFRALLESAPAVDDRGLDWVESTTPEPMAPPVQHPPPESAMVEPPVPASLQPLTARVGRVETALRTFLTSWDGSDPRPRPQAAKEALAALEEREGAK